MTDDIDCVVPGWLELVELIIQGQGGIGQKTHRFRPPQLGPIEGVNGVIDPDRKVIVQVEGNIQRVPVHHQHGDDDQETLESRCRQ